jgi:hypothetical protein
MPVGWSSISLQALAVDLTPLHPDIPTIKALQKHLMTEIHRERRNTGVVSTGAVPVHVAT